jgi:hypothetical protein
MTRHFPLIRATVAIVDFLACVTRISQPEATPFGSTPAQDMGVVEPRGVQVWVPTAASFADISTGEDHVKGMGP